MTRRENLLRGDTLPAAEVARTHCPRGHEYSTNNTKVYRGMRRCKTCDRDRNRRKYWAVRNGD